MEESQIKDDFTHGVYSSRDLRLSTSDIQKIWPKFKEEFGLASGVSLEISCTFRSEKAQNDAYKRGRSTPPIGKKHIITHADGTDKKSKHQLFPSPAIDVWICAQGKAIWDEELFELAGKIGESMGLNWGGNFKGLVDMCHFEVDPYS